MQIVVYRNTFLINELLNCQLYIASDDDFLILIRIASNRKSTNMDTEERRHGKRDGEEEYTKDHATTTFEKTRGYVSLSLLGLFSLLLFWKR